jgi:hypothetical protein
MNVLVYARARARVCGCMYDCIYPCMYVVMYVRMYVCVGACRVRACVCATLATPLLTHLFLGFFLFGHEEHQVRVGAAFLIRVALRPIVCVSMCARARDMQSHTHRP